VIPAQDFIAAIQAGDDARVRQLLVEDDTLIEARTERGLSMLLLAVYSGQPEIAKTLIEHHAPLDIFEAAAIGNAERVGEWLDLQPNLVNAFAHDGFTPLGLGAFFGHRNVVELVLTRGANPNLASNNSQQVAPLNSAAAGQHLDIARVLIAQGADVNARQTGGFVPLHSAAQNGQIEMIRLLIEHAADLNAKSETGMTPFDYAIQANHNEAANLLDTYKEK
jgi:uncharacterized protein